MRGSGRTLVSLGMATVGALLAGSAVALPPCPTWFPDFRGCDRHGRYDGFVAPMMHPYLFEDPFITTGVSAWGLWHQFPDDSILNGGDVIPDSLRDGGDLWLAAVQARVAITDRVAFIATKDGWVDFNPGLKLLDDDEGLTDVTAGFKVAAIDDRENRFILSPSLRYQLEIGDHGVLQGFGDGVFIPDISAGWAPIERFHVLADFGGQFPLDTEKNSTSLFYHLHLDYEVHRHFVPFVEIGGFHYLDGGNGSTKLKLAGGDHITVGAAQTLLQTDPEEGYDYANIGAPGVAGDDVVAWSVGFRVPLNRHLSFGVAYERPITENKDVLSQRAAVNALVEF